MSKDGLEYLILTRQFEGRRDIGKKTLAILSEWVCGLGFERDSKKTTFIKNHKGHEILENYDYQLPERTRQTRSKFVYL